MSEINIDLLKQIRDKIAASPQAYDQGVFARSAPDAPCGTAACIAGWACVLSGEMDIPELRRREDSYGELFESIAATAKKVLRLDGDEAETLFTANPEGEIRDYDDDDDGFDEVNEGWPEPFCDRWESARRQEQPGIAVAYLNHIIETGKVLE